MFPSVNFPPKLQKLLDGVKEENWEEHLLKQKKPWHTLCKLAIFLIQKSNWQENPQLYRHAQKSLGMLFVSENAMDALSKKRKLLDRLLTAKEAFHNAPQQTKAIALQSVLLESAAKKRRVAIIAVGIENQNNDCFMISVIQALRHLPKLKECLTGVEYSLNLKTAFFQLLQELDSGKVISAEKINEFRKSAIKDGFIAESTSSQECAMLFCQFLLGTIGFKNFAFLTPISHALDFPVPALDDQRSTGNLISLPLGQAKDDMELKELLMANCVKEEVDLNSIYNNKDVYLSEDVLLKLQEFHKKPGMVDTLQTILLKSNDVPKVLVLGLRRFEFKDKQPHKLTTRIVPSPVIKIAAKAPDGTLTLEEYHLKALVVHEGKSTSSGHYYTYVTQRECWVEFSDARVVEHKEYKTQKRIPDDKNSLTPFEDGCRNGYLYFYQKM